MYEQNRTNNLERKRPVDAVIDGPHEMAELLVGSTGLEVVLSDFVFARKDIETDQIVSQGDVERKLYEYVERLTDIASFSSSLDTLQIRAGFETIQDHMNRVVNTKLDRPGRRNVFRMLFDSYGSLPPRKVVADLDDRFWDIQYKEELATWQVEHSDALKPTEFVYSIFHGFALAPFSFAQQAERWA